MRFKVKENRQNKTVQITAALSDFFEEYNLKEKILMGRVLNMWPDIVGTMLANHSIPDRIFKNFLFISVDHPVYSNTISFMKDIIIEKVNRDYPQVIKDIRLEIKKLDWKKIKPDNIN